MKRFTQWMAMVLTLCLVMAGTIVPAQAEDAAAQAILDGRESRMSTDISVHVVEALNAFEESAKTGSAYIMQTSCKPTAPMGKDWALWEVR